ncbi:LysR substrate-binding domain-containing protein [Robbsia sp. KACC 23696]|uniref:LysR family transcriptional regulator n=1 Tax=Robbsia sp. KACC 23696 TaxID=3149231 RepID=UPI00325AB02D
MTQTPIDSRRLAISLRQLEIFRAIMVTGSVSEAARMLTIAQPSVSRVLQLTEERVGFLLFERVRGRLSPTPEAKRIFEEVESAYAGIQRVDDLIRALQEGRSGKVNIVCSPSLGVHIIPRAIARFKRIYPELPIHFEPLTHNNLIPRLLYGTNYLGISMFGVTHPNLEAEPLAEVPLMVVAPKGHFAGIEEVTLESIRHAPWIDYPYDTPMGMIVDKAFGGTPRPTPEIEVRSTISACQLAMQGIGVAIVDPFCIDDNLRAHLDVRPLAGKLTMRAEAVYARAEPLSHAARSFFSTVKAILAQDQPAVGAAR